MLNFYWILLIFSFYFFHPLSFGSESCLQLDRSRFNWALNDSNGTKEHRIESGEDGSIVYSTHRYVKNYIGGCEIVKTAKKKSLFGAYRDVEKVSLCVAHEAQPKFKGDINNNYLTFFINVKLSGVSQSRVYSRSFPLNVGNYRKSGKQGLLSFSANKKLEFSFSDYDPEVYYSKRFDSNDKNGYYKISTKPSSDNFEIEWALGVSGLKLKKIANAVFKCSKFENNNKPADEYPLESLNEVKLQSGDIIEKGNRVFISSGLGVGQVFLATRFFRRKDKLYVFGRSPILIPTRFSSKYKYFLKESTELTSEKIPFSLATIWESAKELEHSSPLEEFGFKDLKKRKDFINTLVCYRTNNLVNFSLSALTTGSRYSFVSSRGKTTLFIKTYFSSHPKFGKIIGEEVLVRKVIEDYYINQENLKGSFIIKGVDENKNQVLYCPFYESNFVTKIPKAKY